MTESKHHKFTEYFTDVISHQDYDRSASQRRKYLNEHQNILQKEIELERSKDYQGRGSSHKKNR